MLACFDYQCPGGWLGGQPSRMGWDLLNNLYLLNLYSLFKKVFSLCLSLCFKFPIVL